MMSLEGKSINNTAFTDISKSVLVLISVAVYFACMLFFVMGMPLYITIRPNVIVNSS
jgi:hypothetical protein